MAPEKTVLKAGITKEGKPTKPGCVAPCAKKKKKTKFKEVTPKYTNNADGTVTAKWGSMTIKGKKADVNSFIKMTKQDMGATKAGRTQLSAILKDTAHPTTYNVGRDQSDTTIDNYGTKNVDLDDLEKFPQSAPKDHPNSMTRGEWISHFVNERVHGGDFGPAHRAGITSQNAIRTELGQSPAINQALSGTDAKGNVLGQTNFVDGTSQTVHITSIKDGKIVSIDQP